MSKHQCSHPFYHSDFEFHLSFVIGALDFSVISSVWQTIVVFEIQMSKLKCQNISVLTYFIIRILGFICHWGFGFSCHIIGIFTPYFFANSIAFSYPASAWRIIPVPGSLVNTRFKRVSIISVPSATITCPAWSE